MARHILNVKFPHRRYQPHLYIWVIPIITLLPGRHLTIKEINQSLYTYLYPYRFLEGLREMQRQLSDTHLAVVLFHLKREDVEVPLIPDGLMQLTALPEPIKMHILSYLVPEEMILALHSFVQGWRDRIGVIKGRLRDNNEVIWTIS